MGNILCSFEQGWKTGWVAAGSVRRSPPIPDSTISYSISQHVEVKAQALESLPCGWWKGVIKSIKNNVIFPAENYFFLITF